MSQEHMWESVIYILPLFTGVAQVCEQWDGQLGWEFSTAVKTARPPGGPPALWHKEAMEWLQEVGA